MPSLSIMAMISFIGVLVIWAMSARSFITDNGIDTVLDTHSASEMVFFFGFSFAFYPPGA